MIILMASGHWVKALILVAWAVAIVSPVDNIIRPWLVGRQAKVSQLYLFFAILGGVKAFGLIGLLVGPVVLSVTVVLFSILRDQINQRNQVRYDEHGVREKEDAGKSRLCYKRLGSPLVFC